jgi:hypothetical protein
MKNMDAEQLQQNKWVKVRKLYQMMVYFIYSTRLHIFFGTSLYWGGASLRLLLK